MRSLVHLPAALLTFDSIRHSQDWARWRTLAADGPPFLAPEFFALTRPLARGGTPLVAEAWTTSQVVGALPLHLEGTLLSDLWLSHWVDQDVGLDAATVDHAPGGRDVPADRELDG